MARYRLTANEREGDTIYTLCDHVTRTAARVWPAFGANCIAYQRYIGDTPVQVVLGPERLDQLRDRPWWYGAPLLFPFPGRIPGGAFTFRGRTYQLDVNDREGNTAIHGVVGSRPWRVELVEYDDSAGARLACSFRSAHHPDVLRQYPFPFALRVTYLLLDGALALHAEVTNEGAEPLPMAFGVHPYFRLPLAAAGTREHCLVHVPARSRWDAQALASGETVGLKSPVTDQLDLRAPRGVALAGRRFDGAFTGLERRDGWVECWLRDPAADLEAVVQASPEFGTIVVYTPPDRPAICLEPWTCPPNAVNVAERGAEGTGLVVLDPGQTWRGAIRLLLRQPG